LVIEFDQITIEKNRITKMIFKILRVGVRVREEKHGQS
jgi:hypothetical protein